MTCWMVSAVDQCSQDDEGQDLLDKRRAVDPSRVFHVPRPPPIMLSTCHDASFLIADTGCQRQVAGTSWHEQKQSELQPHLRMSYPEVCKFSFGPRPGTPSLGRHVYPAGIAGECVALAVSEVSAAAPGLLSRVALQTLGAVPDLLEGKVHFRALNNKSTRLYLSPCGHLALKIDQWPATLTWPPRDMPSLSTGPADAWHPNAFAPEQFALETLSNKSVRAPPNASQVLTSSMASEVANADGAPVRAHPLCELHDSLLLLGHAAPPAEGRHPPALLLSELGSHDAEHASCDGRARGTGAQQVRAESGVLQTSLGSQSISRGGPQAKHLRPVRQSLCDPATDRPVRARDPEGQPECKDSAQPQREPPRQARNGAWRNPNP